LRYAFKQEIYLSREGRNFIVATDMKYLVGMLNNLGKILNATINNLVGYIKTNLFFEIVYKKGKIFEIDKLLRRKWYTEDLPLDKFEDSSDNEKGDILILLL